MEFDFENETIEFKREFTKDIKKEVIAFANSFGGIIYVGLDKKGNYYPIEDIDETMQQITNTIRDSISPDVTFFVRYQIEDKKIIKITVNEGSNKPYFLNEKGLTPSGVYIRQGNTSAPASRELIRRMIKITDGDKYEDERALNQDLTFNEAMSEFRKNNLELKENNMITLGMKTTDNLFTNLGVVLSDQCQHTVKIAVFKGTKGNSKMEFKTRTELTSSIFRQLYEAEVFLKAYNKLPAKIVGLKRVERQDYPPNAVREALINALIHRDYSLEASTMINIYDDCIDFISLGGLVAGLSEKDLFKGISFPRNKKFADIFLRLDYIEAYGTGLRKIMELYQESELKPNVDISPNVFVMTLPNLNYMNKLIEDLDPNHKMVLEYLRSNDKIKNSDVQKLFSIKQSRAYTILKTMKKLALIKEGKKRGEYISNA